MLIAIIDSPPPRHLKDWGNTIYLPSFLCTINNITINSGWGGGSDGKKEFLKICMVKIQLALKAKRKN